VEPPSPAASVLIVNWNSGDDLRRCLESVMAQEGVPFDVTVVDNASRDGSVSRAAAAFPRVRYIVNDANIGFGAAVNRGIRHCFGDWIALLNPDAVAEPGWLAKMVRTASRPGPLRVGAVAPKVLFDPPDPARVIDSCGHQLGRDGQNFCRGRGEPDAGQYDREDLVFSFSGAACLLSREMIDQIGGFVEDYFLYGEDAELGLRAYLAGWRCVTAPSAVVRHRLSRGLGRFSLLKAFYIERNRLWLLWTHFPIGLILASPLHRLRHISRYFSFARRRRREFAWWAAVSAPLALLLAKAAATARLPVILRRRRIFHRRWPANRGRTFGELFERFEMTPSQMAERY